MTTFADVLDETQLETFWRRCVEPLFGYEALPLDVLLGMFDPMSETNGENVARWISAMRRGGLGDMEQCLTGFAEPVERPVRQRSSDDVRKWTWTT